MYSCYKSSFLKKHFIFAYPYGVNNQLSLYHLGPDLVGFYLYIEHFVNGLYFLTTVSNGCFNSWIFGPPKKKFQKLYLSYIPHRIAAV